ncbi:MAG: methyltransferase domain-containing protein [Candidatus Adiutrix sp.]|jgi:phospholipid N-methyltransferase|nr:methyltransferase domain-containing protein [Candidatus Adiutrix sp.]
MREESASGYSHTRNRSLVRDVMARLRLGWQSGLRELGKKSRSPWAVFILECLCSPRLSGAICPSGRALARTMAEAVPSGHGLIVELGAGTGSVTSALLKKGIAPERLITVEQSAALAEVLKRRFPAIRVIHGDAAVLTQLLPEGEVDCVVSSIPLVSLPGPTRTAIVSEVIKVLKGGQMIQFTYWWGGAYLSQFGFKHVKSQFVLKNMPPARVMTFQGAGPKPIT